MGIEAFAADCSPSLRIFFEALRSRYLELLLAKFSINLPE